MNPDRNFLFILNFHSVKHLTNKNKNDTNTIVNNFLCNFV
jgi:hypothetical protein